MAETVLEIEERLLLRDGVLPADRDTFQATSTGDWPTVAGRENFRGAHMRRATTVQGTLVHRPLYGGNLPLNIGVLDSDTQRSVLQNTIRTNALRDPRTGEAIVRVSEDGVVASQIYVDLEVTPLRNSEIAERTGFTLEV